MKNGCIIFLLSIIISLTAVGFLTARNTPATQYEYLRIHIRADSNEAEAQAVKYLVRDDVVEYLTPIVANCNGMEEAEKEISACLSSVRQVAERTLQRNGFSYGAKAQLKTETFPTRVYGEYTLPKGEYTALIIELGSGKGDNWWCVVYPPLCFTSPAGGNVTYKSKIAEIIKDWKAKLEK